MGQSKRSKRLKRTPRVRGLTAVSGDIPWLHAPAGVPQSAKKAGRIVATTKWNGGQPWTVVVEPDRFIKVFRNDEETSKPAARPTMATTADQVWFGDGYWGAGPPDAYSFGNSVLLVKGRTCTVINEEAVQFKLKAGEQVQEFVSKIGNSVVPYGFIKTNKGFYTGFPGCDRGFLSSADAAGTSALDLQCVTRNKKLKDVGVDIIA